MLFIYILNACIIILLLEILKKIDTAIELIYNRLNVDVEMWGSDKD